MSIEVQIAKLPEWLQGDRSAKTKNLDRALRELKERTMTDNRFLKVRNGRGKEEKDRHYHKRLRQRYDRQLRDLPHSRPKKWEA